MKDTWILFVCAGYWQLDGMLQAKELGYKIFAVDADKNAKGFEIADKYCVVDIHDSERIINIVNDQKIELNGVICLTSDAGQKSAAVIREYFDLPGISPKVAVNMTNKEMQRKELYGKKGVNIPKFLIIENDTIDSNIEKTIGFPCVVKPVDSAGSRGVSIVYQEADLKRSISEASPHSSNGRVIIEEYIDGTEYTIETFTHKAKTNVLLITEKKKIRKTLSNELFSANLLLAEVNKVGGLIDRVFEILEYDSGAGHTEVIKRKNDGKFFLVESAGRGGGFMVSDLLIPLASGYNINEACVTQAIGLAPKPIVREKDSKVVLRFVVSKKGRIESIKGLEECVETGSVKVGKFVEEGDETEDATVDNNRIGFVAAEGKTLSEAFALVNSVEKGVRVKYVNH